MPPVLYLWATGLFLAWGASRLCRLGRDFRLFALVVACLLAGLSLQHELTFPYHEQAERVRGSWYSIQRMAAYCLPVVACLVTRSRREETKAPPPWRLRPEDLYPDPTPPPESDEDRR